MRAGIISIVLLVLAAAGIVMAGDPPEYLNTQYDYEYVREHYPESVWQPYWQRLLDSRFVWVCGALEGEPVVDDTHKVIDGEEQMQCELVEDQNAKIFRLGMTVEYVKSVLVE